MRVPERDGKHSAEAAEAVLAVLLVQVNDRLGIRTCGEMVAAAFEFMPQFGVVVDFPV